LRPAEATVGSRAVAEDACRETWLAVVRGVDRFEGRSSFKTWLFRILLNRARASAGREQRAGRADDDVGERFDENGAWAEPPVPWSDRVDERLVAEHPAGRVHELMPALPDQQPVAPPIACPLNGRSARRVRPPEPSPRTREDCYHRVTNRRRGGGRVIPCT
jgi:RNA polymerase sigma-70 factor, ECF subfamily